MNGAGRLAPEDRALWLDGDLNRSRQDYAAAYDLAEQTQNWPMMANAAVGLGGLWVNEQRTVAAAGWVRDRQRRALNRVDPHGVPALRLRIRLAGEADYREAAHSRILAVLAEARQVGDPVAWAEALSLAHHCLLGPKRAAVRAGLSVELIEVAARTGRRSDLLMGLLWHCVDLFLTGDPHAERRLGELRAALAERSNLVIGFVLSAMEVMLSIRAGRFEQAERAAYACAANGQAAGDADAEIWCTAQLIAIRWFQGRLGELVPQIDELAHSPGQGAVDSSSFAGLAVAAAMAGDQRQAHSALARLAVHDLAALPDSSTSLSTLNGVAHAAYLLAEVKPAAEIHRLLSPFADLPVMVSVGVACFGSAHQAIGLAALTMGDVGDAINHLRSAVRHNQALGHRPAATLSRWYLSQALVRRGRFTDLAEAEQAALASSAEAGDLGMILPPVLAVPAPMGARREQRPSREPAESGPVSCRRRGQAWVVSHGSVQVTVAHSIGMQHLCVLLSNPGHPIPAIDLVKGTGATKRKTDPDDGPAGPLSAQPLLDPEARQAYRVRLDQLAQDIERWAEDQPERAAQAQAERDWLIAELAAATGLGGRQRAFASADERARIAVGKAIRRAIDRIQAADPFIGDELRTTVQTGMWCCYQPG